MQTLVLACISVAAKTYSEAVSNLIRQVLFSRRMKMQPKSEVPRENYKLQRFKTWSTHGENLKNLSGYFACFHRRHSILEVY